MLDKRVIAVFTALTLAMGCLCLRLYVICTNSAQYTSSASHYFDIELADIRGDIFDCNGEKLVCSEYDNVIVAKPTVKALNAIQNVLDSEMYTSVRERMEKGNAVSVNIGKHQIEQNSDAITIKVYNRYVDNQLAQHIIGYINSENDGIYGLEMCYNDILKTDASLTARFSADVYGRIIVGNSIEIQNSKLQKSSVVLTLDKKIQQATENSLDMCDVKEGGAVVVELKTGAVKAIASRPKFNANNVQAVLKDKTSPLVNRGLQAYAVGSIFKVAIAAAAIESGIEDFSFNCKGSYEVDGVIFHCNKRKSHGKLNIKKALECSCNSYFIALAQKVGAKKLLEIANLFGFGQSIKLADGMMAKSGVIPSLASLSSTGALANFSFGQGDFTATMLQLSQMMAAVANGGKYLQPYIVEKVVDGNGKTIENHVEKYPVRAISEKTSEILTEMLESVVENGNAIKARLKNSVKAAGKTATAQTGIFDKNSVEICNTWFGGFFPSDNPKYVVVILKQGGNSGAEDCAPVFKKIADKIYDIEHQN